MTLTEMALLEHRRLLDETMDAYVDWRDECVALSDAYCGWAAAEATDAALAFGAYMAALDREERASQVYADLIRRVGDLVTEGELEGRFVASADGA